MTWPLAGRANEREIAIYKYGLPYVFLNPAMNTASATVIAAAPYITESVEISGTITPERSDKPFGGGSFTDRGTRSGIQASFVVRCFNTSDLYYLQQSIQDLFAIDYTGTLLGAINSGFWIQFGTGTTVIDGATQLLMPRLISDIQVSVENNTYLVAFVIGSDLPFLVSKDHPIALLQSDPLTSIGGGFVVPLTIPFTLTQSSGGQLSALNGYGSYAYKYPIIRIYGPIQNPVLRYIPDSGAYTKQLSFVGSITSGDYWTIDMWSKRVFRNDNENDVITALDVSSSEWFDILQYESAGFQLSGSGYTSQTKMTTQNRLEIA